MSFLKSWAWKREGRLDIQRFYAPYIHPLNDATVASRNSNQKTIHVEQAKSNSKTVWDSSIVLAKYIETLFNKDNSKFTPSTKCLEIGCGCGLPGLVLAYLGCQVVFTDLPEVLHVVEESISRNKFDNCQATSLKWGSDVTSVKKYVPFDIVIATDTMFILEEVDSLFETIMAVSGESTQIFFAYGRNRYAEDLFIDKMKKANLFVREIPLVELDETYQCDDVTVLCITRSPQSIPESSLSVSVEELPQAKSQDTEPKKRKIKQLHDHRNKKPKMQIEQSKPISKIHKKLIEKALKKKLAMTLQAAHHHCDCC